MAAITITTSAGFERALQSARRVGSETPLPGLASLLDGATLGRVSELWDVIDSALRDAYWRGIEIARGTLDEAIRHVDAALAAAGNKAKQIEDALRARLDTYVREFVDDALRRVRDSIQVGERTLPLTSVELSQTVALSGSLKASLQEVASFTATGELVVTSHFGE